MSEEDKISHLMKGIAEELYQALLPRDVQSTEQFITECRRVEALRCRRVTPTRYERLPNVASLCHQDDGEDLSSMIRQIVREEVQRALGSPREEPKNATIEEIVKEEIGRTLAPISKSRSPPQKKNPRQCYYMPHHPEDADYQRILWKPSPEEPVVDYRLLTRQTAVKEVEDLEGLPVYHRAILKENGEWPEVTKAIQSLDLVFILGPADKEHETAEKYLSFFKTRRCELPKFGLLPESTYDLLRSWLRFPSNLNQGSAAGGSMFQP
ncbi:hypothetical protein LAZ67_3004401 [Cordylochernes scorpioides]|uniref:Uncharacterized protein n=1 Tax=Cordylochernes scorpioides TaxID=51811 RepID=A0ABY6K9C7_9ARAC|nr:hypothetical protein LAZ67_3004401 [Cordylochernes scorpioides]